MCFDLISGGVIDDLCPFAVPFGADLIVMQRRRRPSYGATNIVESGCLCRPSSGGLPTLSDVGANSAGGEAGASRLGPR